jgi:hypothetical protein
MTSLSYLLMFFAFLAGIVVGGIALLCYMGFFSPGDEK